MQTTSSCRPAARGSRGNRWRLGDDDVADRGQQRPFGALEQVVDGTQLAGRQADRADLPAERLEDKAVITGAQHGAAADERTVDHHADTAPTATGEWYQGSRFSEIVDSYSKEQ